MGENVGLVGSEIDGEQVFRFPAWIGHAVIIDIEGDVEAGDTWADG